MAESAAERIDRKLWVEPDQCLGLAVEDQKLEPVVNLERRLGVLRLVGEIPLHAIEEALAHLEVAARGLGLAHMMICKGEAEPVDLGNPMAVGPPKIILHQLDSLLVVPGAEEGHRQGVLMPWVTLIRECALGPRDRDAPI